MIRFLCTLLLLPVASTILAAPAPKNDWKQYGWEKPIDPVKDCKFDIKGGTITIEIPGGDHELDSKRERFNAPRILREVEGDFVMQVRISASFRPSATSSVKGEEPRVGAGLVLIPFEKNYLRIEYGACQRKGGLVRTFFNKLWGEKLGITGNAAWNPGDWEANEKNLHLCFQREGNSITQTASPDGKEWSPKMTHDNGEAGLPHKVKVGLVAYSTSTEPFKVRFDEFKLIRPGKQSK